jgi:hypothetical protein
MKLVVFDLRHPRRPGRREKLERLLRGQPEWVRVGESAWIVKTDATVAEVRDEVGDVLGAQDALLVLELRGAEWCCQGLGHVAEWMRAESRRPA